MDKRARNDRWYESQQKDKENVRSRKEKTDWEEKFDQWVKVIYRVGGVAKVIREVQMLVKENRQLAFSLAKVARQNKHLLLAFIMLAAIALSYGIYRYWLRDRDREKRLRATLQATHGEEIPITEEETDELGDDIRREYERSRANRAARAAVGAAAITALRGMQLLAFRRLW